MRNIRLIAPDPITHKWRFGSWSESVLTWKSIFITSVHRTMLCDLLCLEQGPVRCHVDRYDHGDKIPSEILKPPGYNLFLGMRVFEAWFLHLKIGMIIIPYISRVCFENFYIMCSHINLFCKHLLIISFIQSLFVRYSPVSGGGHSVEVGRWPS